MLQILTNPQALKCTLNLPKLDDIVCLFMFFDNILGNFFKEILYIRV